MASVSNWARTKYYRTLAHAASQAVIAYPKVGVYANKLINILELAATAGPDIVPVSRIMDSHMTVHS